MTIYCFQCHEPCGKEYSATSTDPAFAEGIGEDFRDSRNVWHCSEKCLSRTLAIFDHIHESWCAAKYAEEQPCGCGAAKEAKL